MVWKASTSRRALLRGALATGAMSGLAACAPGSAGPAQPGAGAGNRPLRLIWAVRPSGARPEAREKLLQEYKEAKPNVTVEQVDASGGIAPSLEKIAASMAAGTPIDVINGHLAARQLIESIDAVQPIDDLVRRDRFDLNRYNKDALEATGRYDGKLYTLPYAYGGDVAAVVYNKALFRGAGVPEPSSDWSKPWTWDEFRDAMRRLTKSAGSELTQVGLAGFGYWVHTPIMQWGARWLTPDYKTVVCDSQQTIDAYTKFDDLLFKDRVSGPEPGRQPRRRHPFLTGKAAVDMPCCAALNFARTTRGAEHRVGLHHHAPGDGLHARRLAGGDGDRQDLQAEGGRLGVPQVRGRQVPPGRLRRTVCPGCCRTCCPGSRATSPSGRTRGRRCWRRG